MVSRPASVSAAAESPSAPIVIPQRADPDHDYPLVGETLGLWRLIEGVGRGGMGEVYEAEYDYLALLSLRYPPEGRAVVRAELEQLPRAAQARLAGELLGAALPADIRFAIKICNARSGTPGHRRFLQEAEVAQRLGDHPYIVTVHAIHGGLDELSGLSRAIDFERGRHRDIAYMVMDLAKRTYDHARLSVGEAVHVVRCIATALDHAHSKGVVHRDLKPENILGSVEHPLLTDFGIAKEVDQTHGLTRTGQIIGTLDYMSPEQATDAKRVDHRSDIYSLGVVLYEYATQGQLPYAHKLDRDSALSAIRSERVEPKWPREHRSSFPPGLERIILKAMAHRMEDRYQSMSELITDLDRFTRGEWISLWGRVPLRSWARFQIRSHPRTLWAAALAGLVLLVVAAWLVLVPLFDTALRGYDERIARIEATAQTAAQAGAATSLDLLAREDLAKREAQARSELTELQRDDRLRRSYPALHARLTQARSALLRESRLRALFSGSGTSGEAKRSRDVLETAAGERPAWTLDGDGLLVLNEAKQLRLGPYGAGTLYLVLVVVVPEVEQAGFGVEISEADGTANAARLRLRMSDGALRLSRIADGRTSELTAVPGLTGTRFALALEAGPGAVRLWVNDPRPRSLPVRGLPADAAGAVQFDLPRGTAIERLEIWPKGPSSP